MKIAMIGSGYVGLVSGACFANHGNRVYCIDRDKERIESLKNNQLPIYEPGLNTLMQNNICQGSISFHFNLAEVMDTVEIIFIAVGTPMMKSGAADLTAVYAVAKEIGQQMEHPLIVVDKSTVPVGTGDRVHQIIAEELQNRNIAISFSVVSNPEFLKEGKAISDFSSPDRVVLGSDDSKALDTMIELYRPMVYRNPKGRILCMSLRSAELTKYAANAMLATRISFINEIADLCVAVGANIHDVREGIGSDSRIGNSFLYPGVGYGGSCFPKDLVALRHSFEEHKLNAGILKAVTMRNHQQKQWAFRNICEHFGSSQALSGKHFALWGLSYKPDTDDVREAPSLVLIEQLLQAGASISAYCPKGRVQCEVCLEDSNSISDNQQTALHYVASAYEAVAEADALILLTEWHEFLSPDWLRLKNELKTPLLFDGRTQFQPEYLAKLGFTYYAVGLPVNPMAKHS